MFIEPSIYSSFRGTAIGNYLYNYVLRMKPKLILELGVLNGYSTSCFLQAIRDLPRITRIVSVDLFDLYEYNSCPLNTYVNNVSTFYSVSSRHSIVQSDVFSLDFRHLINSYGNYSRDQMLTFIDISNDADTLSTLFKKIESPILFEGGTVERDNISWMHDYAKVPINSLRGNGVDYSVVCEEFPGLSFFDSKSCTP